MGKWWMRDNGTQATDVYFEEGNWIASADCRVDADKFVAAHNADIDALTERAESAERALALSEQIRSISVRADAYEQKCRQLDAAIKRAEEAESRLSSVLDRVGGYVSKQCYCDVLVGDSCEHCDFLRDFWRFAEGRDDE